MKLQEIVDQLQAEHDAAMTLPVIERRYRPSQLQILTTLKNLLNGVGDQEVPAKLEKAIEDVKADVKANDAVGALRSSRRVRFECLEILSTWMNG